MPFLKKTYTFAKKSLLNLYLNFSLQPFPNIVTINKHDCKKVILKENPFKACTRTKRASFLTFRLWGVMTIEAALCLTIFMSAALSVMSLFQMIQTFSGIQSRILTEVRKYSVLSSENIISTAGLYADLYGVADNSENNTIISQVSALGTHTEPSSGKIAAKLSYRIHPEFLVLFHGKITLRHEVYLKAWTGYIPDKDESEGEINQAKYYITDYESVYHTKSDCTHLKLSIRMVSLENAMSQLNQNYERYTKCEKCAVNKNVPGNVYITDEGNRYHTSLSCPGLKRTVYTVTDVQGLYPCSRCGL